jgi:hypothetical protein
MLCCQLLAAAPATQQPWAGAPSQRHPQATASSHVCYRPSPPHPTGGRVEPVGVTGCAACVGCRLLLPAHAIAMPFGAMGPQPLMYVIWSPWSKRHHPIITWHTWPPRAHLGCHHLSPGAYRTLHKRTDTWGATESPLSRRTVPLRTHISSHMFEHTGMSGSSKPRPVHQPIPEMLQTAGQVQCKPVVQHIVRGTWCSMTHLLPGVPAWGS